MASARNLCQHSDNDQQQCTSNDYALCPHCQLQLCLKHLNHHQDLLRTELYLLCHDVDDVRMNFDHLIYDPTKQQVAIFQQLDQWYIDERNTLEKIYFERKCEMETLCLKSRLEFDEYKQKKEKQLKENLSKQLNRVLKQKQIHIDDLNEMKSKLDYIQRGLNELKQFNILIDCQHSNIHFNVIKKRYIEAAKPLFNDDDNNLWESHLDDDEEEEEEEMKFPRDESFSSQTNHVSSHVITRKTPLKLIIKRLRHPTRRTEIKYRTHTVHSALPLVT